MRRIRFIGLIHWGWREYSKGHVLVLHQEEIIKSINKILIGIFRLIRVTELKRIWSWLKKEKILLTLRMEIFSAKLASL